MLTHDRAACSDANWSLNGPFLDQVASLLKLLDELEELQAPFQLVDADVCLTAYRVCRVNIMFHVYLWGGDC